MTTPNRLAALSCAALVATTAAGCASVEKAAGGGGDGTITMGTTNVTSVLDPAGAYDAGSWLVLNNSFQSLLSFPSGATVPQPDAAESCQFTGSDALTYTCTLRSGLKFTNGHPLTAQDVKFSIDRVKKIDDPSGPGPLLSTIKSVEVSGDRDVTFRLESPDAVLPAKLASAAGAIVDHQVFPADKLLENGRLVGSGPYKIDSIEAKGKAPGTVRLSANPGYHGIAKLQNDKFAVRYFDKPDELKSAIESGAVDVTDSSLDPATSARIKDEDMAGTGKLRVAEGASGETRYLVFNTKDETGGNQAVRQAAAQLIDRKALSHDVYAGTVQPLYSVVPAGLAGHNTAFFDKYGEPDPAKAKKILNNAHVTTPVKLNLTWSRARAGAGEMNAVKEQLENGGLFQVNVQEEPDWTAYQAGWKNGSYQAYPVGWIPDYADADDYISPLVVDGGAFHNGWNSTQISDRLVPDSIKLTDRSGGGAYDQIQKILADAVPMIPLFQNKSFYVYHPGITGVDATVDNTGVFRFWEIGRTSK
ncbi:MULTISPECIES: ABC transporter substrate-binding protein [Kitasatospora]|uniref:Putative ABC transporter substrate-binding protein n=1 Tax=Kitasatospora setae (strain ATCC 33774 / DSM 43861 / JCM 3304 / KCC A-0304 / NBRC 14216 / KM-6054) TaxID=452652 RepID=E4N2M8_KITSK|nr:MULTISPECIES: ABC transporter substrate-binding protein [Kitasatospora]BAJ32412.1 putative ABC transporter substrate-binding protein [Kitasatospora setae KM-6054]